jgi:hypothetical protein
MVEAIETFLTTHDGKLRISIDSVTEMAYYADEERTRTAVEQILDLLDEHDAIGIFHVAEEVHEDEVVDGYRDLFDGVIELEEDGRVESTFE